VLIYTLKRLLFMLPILLGVTLVAFAVTRVLPGDPARIYAGSQADEATVESVRREFGFDQPLHIQYVAYVSGLLRGDLGFSIRTRNPVADDLLVRAPATFELAAAAMILAIAIAVPIGVVSAVKQGTAVDKAARFGSTVGLSLPDFWLGLLLILVLYVWLGWAPAPVGRLGLLADRPPPVTGLFTIDALLAGDFKAFGDVLAHLMMPALALAIPAAGPLMRLTRNSTIDVLRSDYILFAKATGLRGLRLHFKYVLRNSIPNTVTLAAMLFGYLLGGTVLVEKLFAWPGLGMYAANSLDFNDFAAIQGFVLLSAAVYMTVFIVLDIVHSWLDPRVRLQ
jgi:ABC-type dipeptide/oligopeptide/nickel transport system permease component